MILGFLVNLAGFLFSRCHRVDNVDFIINGTQGWAFLTQLFWLSLSSVVGGDDLDVEAAILMHTARSVTCCAEGNTGQKLEQLTVGWGMGQ